MDTRKRTTPLTRFKPNWKYLETKSFADRILKWAGQNFSEFPWRRNRSPYEILVAEFLLKRTTATAVSRVYDNFLVRFPDPEKIASTSENELIEFLSGVGLQRQRARSLKRMVTWLLTNCEGEVPCDLESLMGVPGLGDYSAAAILSFGFGKPIAVVDANVDRIITRVFANSLPVRPSITILNEVAQNLLPLDKHREYNYGLLDFGRLICRYADPKCGVCPLKSICDSSVKSSAENIWGESTKHTEAPKSRLRIARQNSGLSLQRLAELAGVSKLTVIRIESGRTSPRHKTLERLATVLQVGPEELMG